MSAINVTDTDSQIVAPGFCDFIHIYNNSDVQIFVSYNGAAATVAGGMPIDPGQNLQLNNDGAKQIFTRGVRAIHGSAGENKEIRVSQG